MAVCQHKLMQSLEEWGTFLVSNGTCLGCGEVIDELMNLRAQLDETRVERDAAIERGRALFGLYQQMRAEALSALNVAETAIAKGKQVQARVKRLRRGFVIAQNKWEGWASSELEGTSLFAGAMAEAEKNRVILDR